MNKVYNEILELLDNIPKEDYYKIPEELIEYFENNRDLEYCFSLDLDTPLNEQNISRDTYALYIDLYKTYIVDKTEKEKIDEMLKANDKLHERIKEQKYNINIFEEKNRSINNLKYITVEKDKQMEIKKNNIFTKIKAFITSFFR